MSTDEPKPRDASIFSLPENREITARLKQAQSLFDDNMQKLRGVADFRTVHDDLYMSAIGEVFRTMRGIFQSMGKRVEKAMQPVWRRDIQKITLAHMPIYDSPDVIEELARRFWNLEDRRLFCEGLGIVFRASLMTKAKPSPAALEASGEISARLTEMMAARETAFGGVEPYSSVRSRLRLRGRDFGLRVDAWRNRHRRGPRDK